MSGLYKFDFFPKDWFADTRDLSQAAKGLYIDLLAAIYHRAGALPYNEPDLCKLTGCATVRSFRPLFDELVKKGKLRVIDGLVMNGRANEEIARIEALKAASSEGGKSPRKPRTTGIRPEYDGNTTGTQLETKANIEQIQELDMKPSPSPSPSIGKKEYTYTGKVIRLTADDHQTWRDRYHAIPDLDAELEGLDKWYDAAHPAGDPARSKWWHAVQGALLKKHQKWALERERRAGQPEDVVAEFDRQYREMGLRG